MGSTVSTAKKVAAFQTPQGQTAYVLFEERYSKNSYPHHPNWGCVGFGYLADVVAYIFAFASDCESGMLQSRKGHLRPEKYIGDWLEQLANPVAMPDVSKNVAYGTALSSVLTPAIRERVTQSLVDAGMQHVCNAIEQGGFEASLHSDFDVLRTIYTRLPMDIGSWRFVGSTYGVITAGIQCPNLGYRPTPIKAPAVTTSAMARVKTDNVLVQQPDGRYKSNGVDYSLVALFVMGYAQTELQFPGNYSKAIKAYRQSVADAPPASLDTRVRVSAQLATDKYELQLIKRFADVMGQSAPEFDVTLAQVMANDSRNHALYDLCGIKSAVWTVMGQATPQQETADLFCA